MHYDLFFGEIRIGTVTEDDSDFPNLSGVITYDESNSQSDSEEHTRLVQFVNLNRECTRLVDIEDQEGVSRELAEVNRQLEAFMDYIESDDWRLIDENGNTLPILVPIFRHDGEIVWRWNPAT